MRAGSPGGGGRSSLGSCSIVGEGLIGRENDAPQAFAKRGAHDRGGPRGRADRDRLARPVDLVITTLGRSDGLRQEGELLREHLLERAMAGEEAVAHEECLLAVSDHVALRAPVVIRLGLPGDPHGRDDQLERKQECKRAGHGSDDIEPCRRFRSLHSP